MSNAPAVPDDRDRSEDLSDSGARPSGSDGGSAGGRPSSRRLTRWLTVGVGVLVGLGLVIAGATIPLNYVIEEPGPTWNVLGGSGDTDLLVVSGTETYQAGGALRMTTVSVSGCPGYPVTFFDLLGAWMSSEATVLDREDVCPSSLSQDEIEATNEREMSQSQDTAVVAALMQTGLATRMVLTVAGTSDDQAGAVFQEGDQILSLTPADGPTTSPATYSELQTLMESTPPGTEMRVSLMRQGSPTEVTVTSQQPHDDRAGSILGVYLNVTADSPVDARFGLSDVGGPSAGMMFSLGIVDEVTPGDMTGGKDIAGTGTIAITGEVGPIGGIRQKMAGARSDGSTYFLAPASNCDEVVGHEPQGMEVFAVSTLDEAVTAVESIASGDTGDLTSCEAVLTTP